MTPKNRQTATWIFEALPRFFDNENYGDWIANIHIKIIGVADFTLLIENGTALVSENLTGTQTCKLTMTTDAFWGIVKDHTTYEEYRSQRSLTTTDNKTFETLFNAFNFSILKNIYKEIPIRILLNENPKKGHTEIHKQYGEQINRFFRKKLGFGDLSDDAYNSWFVDLIESLSKFRWETTLLSWCYLIARSSLNKILREVIKNRGIERLRTTMLSKIEDKASFDTIDGVLLHIGKSFLRLQEDILSPYERKIIKHYCKELKSWKEIAFIFLNSSSDEEKLERESNRLKTIVQKKLKIGSWQPDNGLSSYSSKKLSEIAQKMTLKTRITEKEIIHLLQKAEPFWSEIVKTIYTHTPHQTLIDREAARLRGQYQRTKTVLDREAEKQGHKAKINLCRELNKK